MTLDIVLPVSLRKPRLHRPEASEYLRLVHGITIAPATLATMVSVGGGPPYQKYGSRPLYPVTELDRWAAEKLGAMRHNSSEVD